MAGVSRSTVSRVVNGYSNVPEHTRDRVMKVINENEYYPLLSGQLLAGKSTGTVGFFWVSNGGIANDMLCSEYFAHVTESAAELGYLVLTCIVKNLTDQENIDWIKRVFIQGRVDAGIFIGVKNNEPLVEELLSKGKVVGIFDHHHPDRNEANRISVNYETDTGAKIIRYLFSLGHRKIALIDGDISRFSMLKRHESFLTGMQELDLEIRSEWMCYADIFSEPRAGYESAKRLLDGCTEQPTAICAGNDSIAFGIYEALEELDITVPDQISVIGIDGHGRGELSTPPLTTFSFNYKDMFYSLVKRTISAIEQEQENPLTEFMPGTLAERYSCKSIDTIKK
jgi:LacI family transcriptional regulator